MSDQLSLGLEPDAPRLPVTLRPMLARPARAAFDSAEHLFEPVWGGERALAFVERDAEAPPGQGRDVRILDGRGHDVGPLLPELLGLAGRIEALSAVLDGELVVVDRTGRAEPAALARRLAGGPGRPVAYLAFDLLYLDGRPLLGLPLERRRAILRSVLAPGGPVVVVPAVLGEGLALHEACVAQGIAGLMARELRSPYLPGIRSHLWRSVAANRAGSARPGEAGDEPPLEPTAPLLALISRLPFDEG